MDTKLKKLKLCLFLMVLLSFTSCVNDDEPLDPSTHNPNLIGKWRGEVKVNNYYEQETLEFKANGRFTDEVIFSDGKNKYTTTIKGAWTSTFNNISITVTDFKNNNPIYDSGLYVGAVATMPYRIINNELYINNGEVPMIKK